MIRSRKQTTFGKLRRIRTLDRSRIEYRINLIDGHYISIVRKTARSFDYSSLDVDYIPYYIVSNSFDDIRIRCDKWQNAVSNAWEECRRIDAI